MTIQITVLYLHSKRFNMSLFKKTEIQKKAKTVPEAIGMCIEFVQNNKNITIAHWGHLGTREHLIVTQKDKVIFELKRYSAYRERSYFIDAFGIREDINDKKYYDLADSLLDLCISKRFTCCEQKTKQSLFTRIMERIRS